jgi:hypothetical protein
MPGDPRISLELLSDPELQMRLKKCAEHAFENGIGHYNGKTSLFWLILYVSAVVKPLYGA